MNRCYYSALLLFCALLAPTVTKAEDTARSCANTFGCQNCLENPSGCVFAIGQCLSQCSPQTEGATCYSTDNYPNTDTTTICDLADEDQALCTARGSCAACTSTVKSDGNVCHWYELAEACFGGGCGPFGCGITQCDAEVDAPPTDPPVADTNTDTDGPTVAPIITTTTSPTLAQTEPVTEAPVTNPPTVEQTTVSPTAPSVDCSTITDCEGCVAAGCAFAVGACLESCNVIADAACYSTDQPSFMDLSAQEICEIQMNAVADAAACSQGTDCESCVSITLSDPESTCFWRASDNVCSATACDQTGACGVSTCDAGPDALCQAAGSDCATCLEASCAWLSQTQTCVPSCDVATNGDNCFSSEVFPQSNNQDICEAAVTSPEDTVLCFDQTDCESCITTEKEDGTFCEWYMDEETNIQWCQTGGCDSNGICGMQQCPETPMEDDIVVTMRPTMSLGFNDTNSTCDMLEDCTTCIDIGCAWLGRSCADSCEDANMDEDVVCTVPIMGMSNMDTCNAAADVSLCASKNYCFTCTSTVMSDGITTCSWYVDGAREWCDIGGCNADGICGDPDEASCQVVTDPIGPPAPQLAPTPPPASGALSRHQPTQLFGLVVVAGLVGLGMLA